MSWQEKSPLTYLLYHLELWFMFSLCPMSSLYVDHYHRVRSFFFFKFYFHFKMGRWKGNKTFMISLLFLNSRVGIWPPRSRNWSNSFDQTLLSRRTELHQQFLVESPSMLMDIQVDCILPFIYLILACAFF